MTTVNARIAADAERLYLASKRGRRETASAERFLARLAQGPVRIQGIVDGRGGKPR